MNLQWLSSLLILSAAVVYALWRLWRAFCQSDTPCSTCAGCPLKDKDKNYFACEKKK